MTISTALSSISQGVRDRLDPEAAKRRQEAARDQEIRAAERRMDLRWLLGDARGRRIAALLLSRCHLIASTFQSDQRLTDRAEGRRELGLLLFAEMTGAAPEETLDLFRLDPAWQRARDAAKPKDAKKA